MIRPTQDFILVKPQAVALWMSWWGIKSVTETVAILTGLSSKMAAKSTNLSAD